MSSPELLDRIVAVDRPRGSDSRVEGCGCEQSKGSEFKGRVAVHELMAINDELRDLITSRAPEHRIREAVRRNGMRTLLEDGVAKAALGATTLDEVLRAVSADEVVRDEGAIACSSPCRARIGHAIHSAVPGPGAAGTRGTGRARFYGCSGKPCALLVEGGPTVLTVVKYFLELEGFEMLTASDGEQGLEIARREIPDVVVSDLRMPGLDGMDLIRELRASESTRPIAIIILTSDDSLDTEERCLAVGADESIVKIRGAAAARRAN
jgi:CheY-like chemotaxis protein